MIYVSLGCNCQIAETLREYGKRTEAFPFDWLWTNFSFVYESIRSRFHQNFEFDLEKLKTSSNQDHFYVSDGKTFTSVHDFDDVVKGVPLDKVLQDVKEKYKRRIQRFLSLCNEEVTFIRLAQVNNETLLLENEDAQELYNLLKQTFPNLEFRLLFLCDRQYTSITNPKIIVSIREFNSPYFSHLKNLIDNKTLR